MIPPRGLMSLWLKVTITFSNCNQNVDEGISLPSELLLMFQLMDRVRGGVDPMIANLESYIVTTGLDDMKASADTITSVSSLIY